MSNHSMDVCIRGSGMVGRALALLLARYRLQVGLVESPAPPAQSPPDIRAYAINHRAQQLLQSLRCWPGPQSATPVRQMRVMGDGAARTVFNASSQHQDAMTWIVDVPALEAMLHQACQYQGGIHPITQAQADAAAATTALTVVCEGKHSATRAALGVDYTVLPYGQTAIATRATLDAPHQQTAWQWFAQDDALGASILALLPLGGMDGREVAVVWSVPHAQVPELLALEDSAFAAALDAAAHSAAPSASSGDAPHICTVQRRQAWPLQWGRAARWVGERTGSGHTRTSWALAGDAAHSVHPLAGQGLNLGLADVAALGTILGQRPAWRSVGDMKLLRQYERQRKAQSALLMAGMDGIQRLFAHNAPAVRTLRNVGLGLFNASGPVKQWVAHQAMY